MSTKRKSPLVPFDESDSAAFGLDETGAIRNPNKPVKSQRNGVSHSKYQPIALGIDPGFTGAIAVATRSRILALLDLELAIPPQDTHWVGQGSPIANKSEISSSKKRNISGSYLSPETLYTFLKPFSSRGGDVKPDIIVIEDVTAMTGLESAASSFKFGQTKGLITGIIYGLFPHTPIRFFKPAVWKGSMGLSSDKQQSLDAAKKQWKHQADIFFRRKKDEGRAEACLLALCGASLVGAKRDDINLNDDDTDD